MKSNPRSQTGDPTPTNRNVPVGRKVTKRIAGSDISIYSSTGMSKEQMAIFGYGPNDTKSRNPVISGFPLKPKKGAVKK